MKKRIKFCRSNCVTNMAHVQLFRHDDGTLELWHYNSNILVLTPEHILQFGDNWDYGSMTRQVCREFCRQYDCEDQYDERKLNVPIVSMKEIENET